MPLGLLLGMLLLAMSSVAHAQQHQAGRHHRSDNAAPKQEIAHPAPFSVPISTKAQPGPDHNERAGDHEQQSREEHNFRGREVRAAEESARVALATYHLSIWSLIVSVCGLIGVFFSFRFSLHALDLTRAEQRPWLKLTAQHESGLVPRTEAPEILHIKLLLTVEHCGIQPAVEARISHLMVARPFGQHPSAEWDQFRRGITGENGDLVGTVLPASRPTTVIWADLPRSEAMAAAAADPLKRFHVFLFVRVDYSSDGVGRKMLTACQYSVGDFNNKLAAPFTKEVPIGDYYSIWMLPDSRMSVHAI